MFCVVSLFSCGGFIRWVKLLRVVGTNVPMQPLIGLGDFIVVFQFVLMAVYYQCVFDCISVSV